MEDLPLGRFAALVPEFAVKDPPFGRTLIMMNDVGTLQGPVTCLAVFLLFLCKYLETNTSIYQ